jgi:hypothetical protein
MKQYQERTLQLPCGSFVTFNLDVRYWDCHDHLCQTGLTSTDHLLKAALKVKDQWPSWLGEACLQDLFATAICEQTLNYSHKMSMS